MTHRRNRHFNLATYLAVPGTWQEMDASFLAAHNLTEQLTHIGNAMIVAITPTVKA